MELSESLLELSELGIGGDLFFFDFRVWRLFCGGESLSSFLIDFFLADPDLDFEGDVLLGLGRSSGDFDLDSLGGVGSLALPSLPSREEPGLESLDEELGLGSHLPFLPLLPSLFL